MHKMSDDQQLICLPELYKIICREYCLIANDFTRIVDTDSESVKLTTYTSTWIRYEYL
jgi:hypothetical protein